MRRAVTAIVFTAATLAVAACGAADIAAPVTVFTTDTQSLTVSATTTLPAKTVARTTTVQATVTTTLNPEEIAAQQAAAAASSEALAAASASSEAASAAALAALTGIEGYEAQAAAAGIPLNTKLWQSRCGNLDQNKGLSGYGDASDTANTVAFRTDLIVRERETEYRIAITNLCPKHLPALDSAVAELAAQDQAKADEAAKKAEGKLVSEGKYLIGTDIQPGTWQSRGEQVTDCYWEISDAQGNILDNNFISIAPQFTIYIPASAAGFTASGCSFEWISE